jgi:hypothetical protein
MHALHIKQFLIQELKVVHLEKDKKFVFGKQKTPKNPKNNTNKKQFQLLVKAKDQSQQEEEEDQGKKSIPMKEREVREEKDKMMDAMLRMLMLLIHR